MYIHSVIVIVGTAIIIGMMLLFVASGESGEGRAVQSVQAWVEADKYIQRGSATHIVYT